MANKKENPTIVLPPFHLNENEMEDLFKALEIDPASTTPGECGKSHPAIGKDIVCDKQQEHVDRHSRYAKGEWWNWENMGLHSK